MKHLINLSALMCVSALTACSPSVPKCSDDQTTNLVKEIADREMGNQLGAEAATMFSYDVKAIRTTNTNEKTGAHECSAELKIKAKNGGENPIPITYTVEKTEDTGQLYVNVFGLK